MTDPETEGRIAAARARTGSPPDLRRRDEAVAWLLARADRAFPRVLALAEANPRDPVVVDLIGRFRRPEAAALLRRAFAHPLTRRPAASGLGLLGDPASRGMLAEAARSDDPAVASAALAGLGAGGDPAVAPLVLAGLAAGHPDLRWTALEVARRLGRLPRGTAERLAAGDPDPGVRALAAAIADEGRAAGSQES